jgi:hypothetical protein
VDCQDGRCIRDQAGACCDNNGCLSQGGRTACSATSNTCGCPANAPRACANNVCIPNSQCCNCGGPCSTCNAATGVCGTVPNGQPGSCGGGQVCQNGACVLNNVGLGQQCNTAANNCSVGTCVGGICQCSGGTTACNGRCVSTQTDGANCGACGVTCGALGCSAGRCNCPAGQTFSGGACRLNDGQACTPNGGTPCLNGCTAWFTDRDGDGFGDSATAAVNRCGTTPPATTPAGGGSFVRQGGDCCDIAGNEDAANAFPGQTQRFFLPALPAQCVRSAATDHDYNCNGRNDGLQIIDCTRRSQANCAISNIVPSPQVDIQVSAEHPDGSVVCGISAGPGTCAFFTADNPSPFGQAGCAPDQVGFTGLSCN